MAAPQQVRILHVHATTLNLGDQALRDALYRVLGTERLSVCEVVNEPLGDRPCIEGAVTGHPLDRHTFARLLDELETADAVVIGGGDLVLSDIGHYLLLRAAREMDVPVVYAGVGMNPRGGSARVDRWRRRELPHARTIVARDADSARRIRETGVPGERVIELPDLAFSFEPGHFDVDPGVELPERPFVAVSVRAPESGSACWGSDAYRALAEGLDRVVARHDVDVVFLPLLNAARDASRRHTAPTQNDEGIARLVACGMAHGDRTRIVSESIDYRQAVALLRRAELCVGTRLHSMIFATLAHTPLVGLSYTLKTDAWLREAIPERCRLDIGRFGGDDLARAVSWALEHRDDLSDRQETHCRELRAEAQGYKGLAERIEPRQHPSPRFGRARAWMAWGRLAARRLAARTLKAFRYANDERPTIDRSFARPRGRRPVGRLLLVAPYFYPAHYGGAVQVYDQLMSRMSGFDAVVLTDRRGVSPATADSFDRTAPRRGYRVRRLDRLQFHGNGRTGLRLLVDAALFSVKTVGGLALELWSARPDAVICGDTLSMGWLMWWLPRSYRLINYVHGEEVTQRLGAGLLSRILRWGQRRIIQRANLTIAVSEFTRRAVRKAAPVPGGRVRIVHNAVNPERFHPPADRRGDRLELGWERLFVLLSIARLCPRKGIDLALKSLARLDKRNELPKNWRYVIGGKGVEAERLRSLAIDLGLGDRVSFIGFVPDDRLATLYGAADLFLMPNVEIDGDTEGFGIAFLEAAACGTPVIGGTAGGTGSAIVYGETGLRIDAGNLDSLCWAVRRLVRNDAERNRMRHVAPGIVHDRFNLNEQARTLRRLMVRMTRRRSA